MPENVSTRKLPDLLTVPCGPNGDVVCPQPFQETVCLLQFPPQDEGYDEVVVEDGLGQGHGGTVTPLAGLHSFAVIQALKTRKKGDLLVFVDHTRWVI